MSAGRPSNICAETLDQLQGFLDRELNDDEVNTIHFHLGKCPPCQHLFRFEEHFRRLVRVRACTELAPPDLRMQIMARLRQIRV
ncbi:MAG: mycothiol system anti-sigma-R factor [Chloroflexota bacterium]